MIAQKQYEDGHLAGWYNVGPDDCDCLTTGELVTLFCDTWGNGLKWIDKYDGGPHEANFLKLDCSKIKQTFGWKASWHIDEAIRRVVDWTQVYLSHGDISKEMEKEILDFMEG